MKVFLDIGAHVGETLSVVLDPRWQFDRIHCFEPAPACWAPLQQLADERVELHRFGLWKETTALVLHNPGAIGASVAADKDPVQQSTECAFVDAGAWFAEHVDAADVVYAKINVEGAEADIVDRLVETGEIAKIDHLVIHLDVVKSPSLRAREPLLRAQLAASGVDVVPADEIIFGGATRGARNWLRWLDSTSPLRDLRYKTLQQRWERLRFLLYPAKQWLVARARTR